MGCYLQTSSSPRVLSIVLLMISAGIVGVGQGTVGSTRGLPSTAAGIHTIQGKVYFPGGSRNAKRVSVRLDSSNFISQTVQTDVDGVFRFSQLEAGPYTISVEGGAEFESAVENVAIDREASNGGRIINIPIYLKPKPNAPAAAVDAYHKAQESEKAGNTKKAIEELNTAVSIAPGFKLALSELGSLYLKSGDMAKAAETFSALVKATPADAIAHQNLGIALFNQKNITDADVHLRQALTLNDKLPLAHYYFALELINFKHYADAESELGLAISNGGDSLPQAHKYLGGVYISLKKNQEAIVELEKYLKLDPKAPDAERIKETINNLRNK